jgi:hypothetical protein
VLVVQVSLETRISGHNSGYNYHSFTIPTDCSPLLEGYQHCLHALTRELLLQALELIFSASFGNIQLHMSTSAFSKDL